jgi:biotin-dependent carboxylase-like uncharacterized protein
MSERTLEVVVAGPFTTVQDLGRPGLAAWGVGRSGVADRRSAALANRVLANPADAAVLEVTFGGVALRARSALTVAVTGAPAPCSVDARPVAHGTPVALAIGARLELGPPPAGVRTYVAVRGGVSVPPVLGSRSYDVLARLGPPPLADGDVLPVGADPAGWPLVEQAVARPLPGDGAGRLTGWAGPHADALEPGPATGPGRWSGAWAGSWTVSSTSDRTGLRLDGRPLARRDTGEWPVEGLVRGAVQLPPSGRPMVLLADHPVTGGYPVIGCLDDDSCDRAAQLRPGEPVVLTLSPAPPLAPGPAAEQPPRGRSRPDSDGAGPAGRA